MAVTWGNVDTIKKTMQKIPKLFILLKWLYLILIAVGTALVGFLQSMIVSWLYSLRWSSTYENVGNTEKNLFLQAAQYIGINLVLAFACSMSLFLISPAAAGSGIPDVKAYLNGVESPIFKNFFTIKTFIAKVIGSALAVSSGLVMGKEGPMLHAGSILAVVLGSSQWMTQKMEQSAHWGLYTYNKDLRDLVAVGAACGVTTAFKAPVGGVLFSMEMSTRWRRELTWWCFLAAAITIVAVRLCVSLCVSGDQTLGLHHVCDKLRYASLIWFKPKYPDPFPYWHVPFVVILAVIMGYLGCLFTSFNTWVCVVRKKWGKKMWARILEVSVISVVTSMVFFVLPYAGACKACDVDKIMVNGQLVNSTTCVTGGEFHIFNGYRCKQDNHYNDLEVLVFNPQGLVAEALFAAHGSAFSFQALSVYALFYWFFAAVTYGAFIPSGLFTPSLIFGGCMGRIFAELLVLMKIVPLTDDGVSHVGMYALLGAAAFLGGLLRMSASMALILMEMTASPIMLPFLMLTLVVAKNVGDLFNHSVFDQQMMLKGLAFVGVENESMQRKLRLDAADVMTTNTGTSTLRAHERVKTLADRLEEHKELQAFAVTREPAVEGGRGNFLGMISRKNVEELLDKHSSACDQDFRNVDCGCAAVELLSLVEIAPIVVPPNMPLPFVYRIFNSEGFNYVPVIRDHGPLDGLVSRADLVSVQNRKLDGFRLQDQLSRMTQQVEEGHILGSMQLQDNVHAAAFKGFLTNPLGKAQEFLAHDDKPEEDERSVFFAGGNGGGAAGPGETAPLLSSIPETSSHADEAVAADFPEATAAHQSRQPATSSLSPLSHPRASATAFAESAEAVGGTPSHSSRSQPGLSGAGGGGGRGGGVPLVVRGRDDVGSGEHYDVRNPMDLSARRDGGGVWGALAGGTTDRGGDSGDGNGAGGNGGDVELGDKRL